MLADFLVTLLRSPDRRRYFSTWGWVDLISSIPMLNVLRVARVVRIVRIIRVFRAVRSARALVAVVVERRAQRAMLAAAHVAILFVVFGSIAVLEVEQVEGANIKSPQDAVWWTVVTLTAVGYGGCRGANVPSELEVTGRTGSLISGLRGATMPRPS